MYRKNCFVVSLIVIVAFFLFGTISFADEVTDIQLAIKAKGAKWTAGQTSISKLSSEEKQKRLGLIKPAQVRDEDILPSQEAVAAAPATLDWRHYGLNNDNYVTPIRDQKSCGSCWAFATTAALESTTLIAQATPGVNLDLSEQILVSCYGDGSCSGGYIDQASDDIRDKGLPLESCYPYTATNGNCSAALTYCPYWPSSTYQINSWFWVTTISASVDAIESALNTYGPLVTTMVVYQDFDYYTGGIYSYSWGTKRGNHAVLIVGYNHTDQYFIVKNSWGPGWGEAGFFNIAYSELSSVVNFGDWTIAYQKSTLPPPAAPSDLTAAAVSSNQINLSWTDNSSNEDGFKIERCTGAGCSSFAQIATVGAGITTYNNIGLTASTTYVYRVRAYNSGGNSAYSNTASAMTPVPPPPAAPSDLTATAVSSSQINLSWTDNSNNETGFMIERCTGDNCSYISAGVNTTTYSDTGLTASTTYTYRVKASNSGSDSAYSNSASATTFALPQPPAAPTNLTATAVSRTQINLSWTDNSSNEDGFKIERCQSYNCKFAQIATVGTNTTSYSDTGVRKGTAYQYRVRSYNTGGNSNYSNTSSAQTPR